MGSNSYTICSQQNVEAQEEPSGFQRRRGVYGVMRYRELAKRLAQIRENETPWSQDQLAPRLGVTGGALSHWENANRQAKLDMLIDWADALGYTLVVELVSKQVGRAARLAARVRGLSDEHVEMVEHLVMALTQGDLNHREYSNLQRTLRSMSRPSGNGGAYVAPPSSKR